MKTARLAISAGLIAAFLAGCEDESRWDDWETSALSVSANGMERTDQPVTVVGAFPESFRIVEIDQSGETIDGAVPFQVDFGSELTFLLTGTTPENGRRFYRIAPGTGAPAAFEPLVAADDGRLYQDQESITVRTVVATYFYHKRGGGFASLVDEDGLDWIGYRPGHGSAGEYRGIPNIIHPEGGLHPGHDSCESRVLADGPLVARIRSTCHDGAWRVGWDIYPSYARMTVEKAGHAYWFLYEGTPGGRLDLEKDYWVQADGTRRQIGADWQGRLEPPRWVYFGSAGLQRVLYFVHHEDDGTFDQFWQMERNMAVFGFGREFQCCAKSLERTPAHFTLGFATSAGHDTIRRTIEGSYVDLKIEKAKIEARP